MSAGGDSVDLLRITTAGSVDDGKSTLVGRLLYDTGSIFDDQLAAVREASRKFGEDATNLALLTDGLRAERDQRITIDVAYRYFTTARRTFILADTPGHQQYTRNMVTGASTADLAIVLVDATRGLHSQSRRHAFIASLLGVPHLIVAINKMDLAGFEQPAYDAIVSEFREFAARLTVADVTYLPVSALHGDNVVRPSTRMPWYAGGTLLERLETVQVSPRNSIDFRLPVQRVVRPDASFRGYAGTVASGSVDLGDEVVVLPSGARTRIDSIVGADGPLQRATGGNAVVITTSEPVDASRGDLIARPRNLPPVGRHFDAYLCWMDAAPLDLAQSYLLRQTTAESSVTVSGIDYRIDVDTLHRDAPVSTLQLNDIGRVSLSTARELCCDAYRNNPACGSFILIDPRTNATVAAGMMRGLSPAITAPPPAPGVVAQAPNVTREEHERRHGHLAGVVWLTGLPGSGKTTIARACERRLFDSGHQVSHLDGDDLRVGLNSDLGFSPAARAENIRRVGHVARLLFDRGSLVVCSFVSPYRRDRDDLRSLVPPDRFVEVHVKASLDTCRSRDPKGHYRRASTGDLTQFTGVSAPYEAPSDPELAIDTDRSSVEEAVAMILHCLETAGWLRGNDRRGPT